MALSGDAKLMFATWRSVTRPLTHDELRWIAMDEIGASTLRLIGRVLVRIAYAAAQCQAK
jgi:hypothetical protein